MDNSGEIARMINSAGEAASNPVNRTFNDLHETAQQAIEQSKQTATSAVSEMMETHNMLRADTTALFERLREANIMLQEVLSGAHENMSALENTLMLRVSEFVKAMNEVTGSTADATDARGNAPSPISATSPPASSPISASWPPSSIAMAAISPRRSS